MNAKEISKSAWERRKEYSQKLRLSMHYSKPPKIKDNQPSHTKNETTKNISRKPISRKPIDRKAFVGVNNKVSRAISNKSTNAAPDRKQKLQEKRKPTPNEGLKLGKTTANITHRGNFEKRPQKTVRNQAASRDRTKNLHQKTAEKRKTPFDASLATERPQGDSDNLKSIQNPPAKRIRRGSFTISTGKENEIGNDLVKSKNQPTIKTPVPKRPEIKTKRNVQPRNGNVPSAAVAIVRAKRETKDSTTQPNVTKKITAQVKRVEEVAKKPTVTQLKRTYHHDVARSEQPLPKNSKMETKDVSAFLDARKNSAKQPMTPLVRLPIRERLAMWRERRQTLEAECAERRKTICTLNDILYASRHERCFMKDTKYCCPYGKKELIAKTKSEKGVVSDTEREKENETPLLVMSPLPCLDIQQTLMDFKDSLAHSNLDEVQQKLSQFKNRVPAVEKNAHYWEILAVIAEKKGDFDEAYRIYEVAAMNECEPVEIIMGALEKFLSRLDENTNVPMQDSVGEATTMANGRDTRRPKIRKHVEVNQHDIFESTLIQYAIHHYSPFINRLSKALNIESPPLVKEFIIPVRRSARISRSAKQNTNTKRDGIRENGKYLVKRNKALFLDE